ncbi:MAG TPA: YetF domain-containing protein [Fimbriimonadaceae bacterium]|nr:YetF domain-containing protein [Fimbriimonadaceae bacterium]
MPVWLDDVTVFAAKTAVVLIVLFLAFRLLGKRQVGQLNIYDLAMIMALANAVQNAMTAGKGDLRVGITSAATLLLVGAALTKLLVRSKRTERLLIGMPTVIVNRGKVLKHRMRRERVTKEELLAAIRQHGLQSPTQVKMAVLEVDGSLSVVPKER